MPRLGRGTPSGRHWHNAHPGRIRRQRLWGHARDGEHVRGLRRAERRRQYRQRRRGRGEQRQQKQKRTKRHLTLFCDDGTKEKKRFGQDKSGIELSNVLVQTAGAVERGHGEKEAGGEGGGSWRRRRRRRRMRKEKRKKKNEEEEVVVEVVVVEKKRKKTEAEVEEAAAAAAEEEEEEEKKKKKKKKNKKKLQKDHKQVAMAATKTNRAGEVWRRGVLAGA